MEASVELGAAQALYPLMFIPGCNTPADVTRAQMQVNVERNLSWLEFEPLKDRPLVIVAGGPSLKTRWHEIVSHGGDILALNNAYGFLMDKGIDPDYFMLLDARADNTAFLRQIGESTRHYIAAQCHPHVFDALEGYDTRLYLTILPDTLELTAHIEKPKHRIAGSVGTVGIKALPLAYALGYRELHLYGYDSSYHDGEHHAFKQTLNDSAKTIEVYLDGKRYVTTPTLAHQVSEFCGFAAGMTRMGFDITLHCTGLLPDMVAYSNREGQKPIEVREREKYEQVWQHRAYRNVAPGERYTSLAVLSLAAKRWDTFIDFGCGTGRAAQRLQNMGYKVTGIDFASNCRDAGTDFPFVCACLWNLPDIKAQFGFCTDVMEHIPTEKVEEVLAQIAARCNAAYFNIATTDDDMGMLIGRTLHMTVMNASEWEKLLRRYWAYVERKGGEGAAQFIVKRMKDFIPPEEFFDHHNETTQPLEKKDSQCNSQAI